MITNNFRSLLTFLQAPSIGIRQDDSSFLNTLRSILLGLFFYYAINIILSPILGLYNDFLKNNIHIDFLQIHKQTLTNAASSRIKLFFLIVFIGPLIEEILFRGWLTSKISFIYLFFIVLFYVCISMLINSPVYTQDINNLLWVKFIIAIILGVIASKFIFTRNIHAFLNDRFPFLFYISSGIFALTHIINFHLTNLWYLVPVFPFVLPQLAFGLIIGYQRVKYGFFAGLFLHIVNNLIVFGVTLYH